MLAPFAIGGANHVLSLRKVTAPDLVYDKAVYLVLCAYSDKDTAVSYPSYQTIAKKAGCSKRRAITAIVHLEELGLIEKQRRINESRYTSNLYTVCDAPQPAPSAPHAPPQPLLGASYAPPSASPATGGAPDAQKPYVLNQKKLNQTYNAEELASAKRKIEYDTLIQEMPDKLSVLEFMPGIVCELSAEPFAQDLCADDVRDFIKSRENTSNLQLLPAIAPTYLRRYTCNFLTTRHRQKQVANVG